MTESTVYVVESDNSMRAGLARVVKSAGLHAETFPSAQDFLARLAVATGPACILADVCMPNVDGLGLQDLLNSVGSTYPIVFIIAGQVDVAVKRDRRIIDKRIGAGSLAVDRSAANADNRTLGGRRR